MSSNFTFLPRISFLLALALSTTNLFASDCYTQSPGVEELGDDYYDLESTQTLSRDENNQLKQFFNDMEGKWKGNSTLMDCRGPDSKPRQVFKTYEVEAEFIQPSHGLNVKISRRDAKQKVTRNDHFPLYDETGLYTIEFQDEGPIVISHKSRRASSQQGKTKEVAKKYSRLVEQITELNLQGNSLNYTVLHFTNGIFVSEETVQLSR